MTNQNPYSEAGTSPPRTPTMGFCPNCGHGVELPLPVEPLYSAETAAMLIPMRIKNLIQWASVHKPLLDPPHYRSWKRQRRRYFTAKDIRTIRAALYSNVRYPKAKRLVQAISERPRSEPADELAASTLWGGNA